MNRVYLDIDGVLIAGDSLLQRKNMNLPTHLISQDAVDVMNKLYDTFFFECILTSSYKNIYELTEINLMLRSAGFRPVITDATPECTSGTTGGAIIMHINQNKLQDNHYVILNDDDDVLVSQNKRFYRTKFSRGLIPEDYPKLRNIMLKSF